MKEAFHYNLNKHIDSYILTISEISNIIPDMVVTAIKVAKGLNIITIPSMNVIIDNISIIPQPLFSIAFKLKANWKRIILCIIIHAPTSVAKNSFIKLGFIISKIPIHIYAIPSTSSKLNDLNSFDEEKYEIICIIPIIDSIIPISITIKFKDSVGLNIKNIAKIISTMEITSDDFANFFNKSLIQYLLVFILL